MRSISLALDIRPCAKARPRVTRNGCFMPKPYVLWRKEFVRQMKAQWDGVPLVGRLEVTARFECKKSLRPDLDNAIGAVLDALQDAGTVPNDSAVRVLHVSAIENTGKDRLHILLDLSSS